MHRVTLWSMSLTANVLRYTHEMPADAYAGQAIVFKIDIEPWGLITDKHLDACMEKYGLKDGDLKGKILCINSGMHRYFDVPKLTIITQQVLV